MNLDRYHELLALFVQGERSVLAELHSLQEEALAWKDKLHAAAETVETAVETKLKPKKKKEEPAEPAPAEPAAQPAPEAPAPAEAEKPAEA